MDIGLSVARIVSSEPINHSIFGAIALINLITTTHAFGKRCPFYFFPLFLIPCWPAFRGPLPLALSAISLRALSSKKNPKWRVLVSDGYDGLDSVFEVGGAYDVPAAFLALNAISSSSMSFFSFLGAFNGLTLPPGLVVSRSI